MRAILTLALGAFALNTFAANFDCSLTPPKERDQDHLVWSYAELLSPSEEQQLNAKLVRFARETSNRILVIIVDTLCGTDEADLAFRIGENWGIGKKEFDNGIVILIKPNGPPGQRKVFIATGYGLEAAIPDLRAKQVVDGTIIPNFKNRNYFAGLDRATDMLMAMAKGEFNEESHGTDRFPWQPLLFFVLFAIVMIFSWRGRVNRYARTNNVDFWTAMWLVSQMNNRHSGRWGGGSGFSGGGGGGGGFGGFGGGSFGGGGAGGSW
ncbi:MAG TPA: TPM domain-containing protein [Flavobacteriales bacterium]|nr:TPM domain-containing protein [Flavobacteriales bacterium]